MPYLPREAYSDIYSVLSSIRASIDSNSLPEDRLEIEFDELQDLFIRFEELRFAFRARTNRGRPKSREQEEQAIYDLRLGLSNLIEDKRTSRLLKTIRYRPSPMITRTRHYILHPDLYDKKITLRDAIYILLVSIEEVPRYEQFSFDDASSESDGAKLRRTIPRRQGVAPVQFRIDGGRLSISPQNASPQSDDIANIASAKKEMIESGERILDHLDRSNCDPRLIENVKDLQTKLSEDTDIVRLGLANLGCEVMCSKFCSELPDAIAAMLQAHTVGVGMYVAQFPEWHRFTERAASANLTPEDTPLIAHAADSVIEHLRSHPAIADPEVPRVLSALNNLIKDPRGASKRAVYAVLRSVENLVIKVFNFGADFFDQTLKKTSDKLSTAVSRAIVISLMTAALAGAVALTPLAGHIAESAWVSRAADVVRDQIGKLTKG